MQPATCGRVRHLQFANYEISCNKLHIIFSRAEIVKMNIHRIGMHSLKNGGQEITYYPNNAHFCQNSN